MATTLEELRAKYGFSNDGALSLVPQPRRPGAIAPTSGPVTLDSLRERYGFVNPAPQPVQVDNTPQWVHQLPEPVRRGAGAAIRGLAGALEPLQFLQDGMFAILAGAIDPNTTISQRLSTMRWQDYVPFGEAPARPASGEEIFTLMGFDETTAKWAGIAADLTVDPLIFGAWLRGASAITKVKGLAKLGDQVDDFLSPIGMGRIVTNVARKSPRMSEFMDARMNAVMSVFRNPDSTVFGIQRFGERSTRALSRILPESQVDRLRYGTETAQQLAEATRGASREARTVAREATEALWRAQNGVAGEHSSQIVRDALNAMEKQRTAWETRLSRLDPTARDIIEQQVYDLVRPTTVKRTVDGRTVEEVIPGVGFLSVMADSRRFYEGAEQATSGLTTLDRGMVGLSREIFDAFPAPRADAPDLFEIAGEAARARVERGAERIAEYSREMSRRANLTPDDAHLAEANLVRAYRGYLADTVQIDAQIGKAMSGFDFVANQIRSRGLELTGNLELGGQVWRRLLQTGVRLGQEGIEREMQSGIGVKLRSLVPSAQEALEVSIRRRQAYQNAVEAERVRLYGGTPEEVSRNLRAYIDDAENLYGKANDAARLIGSAEFARLPSMNTTEARRLRRSIEKAASDYTFRTHQLANATGTGAREVHDVMRTEQRLRDLLEQQLAMIQNTPMGAHYMTDPNSIVTSVGGRKVIQDAIDAIGAANVRRQEARAAARAAEEARSASRQSIRMDAVAAGRGPDDAVTRHLQGVGRSAADQIPIPQVPAGVPRARVEGIDVPMAGNNTTAEDILAGRLRSGKYKTLEEAMDAEITIAEFLDGIADMQALPLGEYLQGLMNGHLRRAYAIFGDSNDFKRYIDSLRVGAIIPSSIIDESNLVRNMAGFENEAELILKYQNLMAQEGRPMMLRKTGIAEYLLANGVEPSRVNGALASMIQSMGPQNGELARYINTLHEMIPNYQNALQRRQDFFTRDRGQPFVANQRFFDPLKQVSREDLEKMAELARSSASLGESIEIGRRVVARQEMFQNIYEVARHRKLIRNTEFTDEFGARYVKYTDTEGVMGGFGGKWIHPHLAEELRRASAVKKNDIPHAFTRIRALITGGYLAAPAVIAANFMGGLYQAATAGMSPATTFKRLLETFQDVNAASLGRRTDFVAEMQRNLDWDVTSLSYQDFEKHLRTIRLDDFGMGPQGLERVFENIATGYERFLQRPGIGKFRTRFAGLEGFQFTENWFKAAGYREMKERLLTRLGKPPTGEDLVRIEKQAAEYARTIVFDYSELPSSLEMLKNTGLVLFPGFAYFLAGRTADAALRRPGTLAVADRLSEALANASLDMDEQIALLLGTPDWMREEQGVPSPFGVRHGPQGEKIVSVLPMNQLVPTSTIWDGLSGAGNPWMESITGGGIWGPLFEVLTALVSGEGDAVLSGRFGNRVFDADSQGMQVGHDVFRFLYNTMAPSNVRRMLSVDYENRLQGLVPSTGRMLTNLAQPSIEAAYSFDEGRTGRPDRAWKDDVIAMFLRSPQTVALDGPISGISRELKAEQARLGEELTMLRRRANRARAQGDEEGYERWANELFSRQTEFNNKWNEFLAFYRNYQDRNRTQVPR